MEIIYIDMISSLYSGSCVCVCVSGLGVLFSVGVCMRNLLIFYRPPKGPRALRVVRHHAHYTHIHMHIYT